MLSTSTVKLKGALSILNTLSPTLSATLQRAPFSTGRVARSATTFPLNPRNQKKTGSLPPYGPVGVAAALKTSPGTAGKRTLFERELSLRDRVALVTGANRGLGLEMAMTLAEAGARAVYCLDLPNSPGGEWIKVQEYLKRMNMENSSSESKFEYISADVRDQENMWRIGQRIGDTEGRVDVCIAAAGIQLGEIDCLEYSADDFQQIMSVNVNGVLYTAQAAGKQMVRFGNGGSIILIASISGHISNNAHKWVPYNTSKSAVLQMARSMACELAPQQIRVNSISPGYIYTNMTGAYLDGNPKFWEEVRSVTPLGRIGRPDELRGLVTWLASDSSSFCTGSDILITGGYHAW